MTLGARRSRVLGAIWVMAGLGLLASAVLLWVDRQTVSVWELPLAVVALGVGAWLWSQRVTIDRHGITVSSLRGTERTLWASIDAVEVQATWWRPALTIHRRGNGSRTSVRTSSGLTSSQRARLFDVMHELSRDHGFTIRRSGAPDVASAADMPASPAAAGPAAAGLALIEAESRSTGDGTTPQPGVDTHSTDDPAATDPPATDPAATDPAATADGSDEGTPGDGVAGEGALVEGLPVDDAQGEEVTDEQDGPRRDEDSAGQANHSPASNEDDAASEGADTDGIDPNATDVIEVIVQHPGHDDTPMAPPTP